MMKRCAAACPRLRRLLTACGGGFQDADEGELDKEKKQEKQNKRQYEKLEGVEEDKEEQEQQQKKKRQKEQKKEGRRITSAEDIDFGDEIEIVENSIMRGATVFDTDEDQNSISVM